MSLNSFESIEIVLEFKNQQNLVPQLFKPDLFSPSYRFEWFPSDVDMVLTKNLKRHLGLTTTSVHVIFFKAQCMSPRAPVLPGAASSDEKPDSVVHYGHAAETKCSSGQRSSATQGVALADELLGLRVARAVELQPAPSATPLTFWTGGLSRRRSSRPRARTSPPRAPPLTALAMHPIVCSRV